MANTNTPNGFTPIKYKNGQPYTGQCRRYYKDAAVVLGIGDPVIRTASSSDPQGGPEVTRATTGAAITGVVVGFDTDADNLFKVGYMASGDSGYVYVADDPNLLFLVQEGGSGTALAITDIGKHIDSVTALDADTTIGRSKYQIDNGAKATDNTWIIEELYRAEDNAVGAYAKWLVSANLHTEVNASATNRTET